MYEKILQKLKEQKGKEITSISDRSLEDMARSLAVVITTDEILQKADFAPVLKSLEGNISHYTAEQVRKAKEEQENARKAELKRAQEEEAKRKRDEEEKAKLKDVPDYVKTLMEQNKLLLEQSQRFAADLTALKTDKLTMSRTERLKKTLENVPTLLQTPILTAFKSASFASEEDFESYLKEVEKSKTEYIQQAKEQGLPTYSPATTPKPPEETGESPILGDARKVVQEQKEKESKIK